MEDHTNLFLFLCIGVAVALLKKEEFTSSGRILPEIQTKGGSGLSQFAGIASLAGVDLGALGNSGADAIRPDLYPDVLNSTPFYIQLFETEVVTKENKKYKFIDYYHQVIEEGEEPKSKLTSKYPVDVPGLIVLNRLNEIRLIDLRQRINSSLDRKSGIISISAKMPDPVVAASVAKFAMSYLMDYVKKYRTEKLRQDVNYLEEQVRASRGKFYSNQEKKARYTDAFQDMRLQAADVARERIDSEYRLSSSFYNELLKKFEEAKFKLQQETPVFQVLEPPITPVKRSEPKRPLVAISFLMLGGIVGIIYALVSKGNYKQVLI